MAGHLVSMGLPCAITALAAGLCIAHVERDRAQHWAGQISHLNDQLEQAAARLEALRIPAALPDHDPCPRWDDRIDAERRRYGELAVNINRHTAPVIPAPPTRGAPRLDQVQIDSYLAAHPTFRSDPDTWWASLGRMKETVRRELLACQFASLGGRLTTFANERQRISELIDRGRLVKTVEDRVRLSLQVDGLTRAIERHMKTAVPMPIINGDARGSVPPRGTIVRLCEPEQSLPHTGAIMRHEVKGDSDLVVRTMRGGGHVYLRLVVSDDPPRTVFAAFVRDGETLNVSVPRGTYDMRFASGERWYGEQYLFGPQTTFSKTDRLLKVDPRHILTIELTPRVDGNLSEIPLEANDF